MTQTRKPCLITVLYRYYIRYQVIYMVTAASSMGSIKMRVYTHTVVRQIKAS